MGVLTESQRREVLERVMRVIDRKFMGPDIDMDSLRSSHERAVITSETPEAFEQALTSLLKDLGTSHTGCFHEGRPRAAG
ncbi:MAG TPA: hypothetical protein VFY10_13770, partial [Dehalococcoidia bacterium]|nr:hypothetical protein [Dehalococcoidia bacterium]